MAQETHAVPRSTRILFGAGSVADGVKNTTFNMFLLFFYTQVAGLSGALAGTAILIALIVDAITDPLIGNISDNVRTRWGRRHPFMYAAALPMAACFVLLFHPPEDTSQAGLFVWMLTFAIGVRFSMTFYLVPSNSLVPEMTPVYDERTSILSFRALFGWLGGIAMVQLGFLHFFAETDLGDGRLDPGAYGAYALTGAAIIIIAILTCALGTHHLIPRLHAPEPSRFSLRRFFVDLKGAFTSRNYVILVLTILTITLATGFTDVMNLYVNTYFWELSAAQIALTVYGALVGALLAFMVTPALSMRTDKQTAAMVCLACVVVVGPAPIILRLLGFMPENGHPALLPILIAYTVFIIFIAVTLTILAGSMIADTIDENELRSGKRQEGLFNAAFGLTAKATSGLGGFVAGIVLDVVDFPTQAAPGEVQQETIMALGLGVGPGILLFWIMAAVILSRYSLRREDHAHIMSTLKVRRAADTTAAPLHPAAAS
jgi:Na+/melibiose symporter-like transporter